MQTYKHIRITEQVYNELVKRTLPKESFTQTIERLLNNLDVATRFTSTSLTIPEGDK